MSDYLQRVSKKLDDLTDEEFTKIIDDVEKSAGWTPDVVYKVYCNDDLQTLPLGILEDMKTYIEQIILDKTYEDKYGNTLCRKCGDKVEGGYCSCFNNK